MLRSHGLVWHQQRPSHTLCLPFLYFPYPPYPTAQPTPTVGACLIPMLQLQLPQTCNFLPHPEQPTNLQPLESGLSCSGYRKPNFSNPDMSGAHGALSMPSRPDVYPYQNAGMDQRQLNHPGYGFNSFNSFNHRQSLSQASSRPTSRPASPVFQAASLPDQSSRGRLSSSNSVASYLQLPPTIAHGKPGSLAEFAAQVSMYFFSLCHVIVLGSYSLETRLLASFGSKA